MNPLTPRRDAMPQVMSRDEAFDYFERLVEQLQRACRVTHVAE